MLAVGLGVKLFLEDLNYVVRLSDLNKKAPLALLPRGRNLRDELEWQ